jgi:hypothetical protein
MGWGSRNGGQGRRRTMEVSWPRWTVATATLRWAPGGKRIDNASLPPRDWLKQEVEEVEESKAELWLRFGRLRCDGELARPRRGLGWHCSSEKAAREEGRRRKCGKLNGDPDFCFHAMHKQRRGSLRAREISHTALGSWPWSATTLLCQSEWKPKTVTDSAILRPNYS